MKHFSLLKPALIALAACASLPGVATAEEPVPNCFIIVDREGMETEFFGAAIRFITDESTGERTAVASADMPDYQFSASWPMSNIAEIRSEYREMTGIAEATAEASVQIGYDGVAISIKGAKPGSIVRIFDAAGRAVATRTLSSEACTISPASLSRGVYIVELNGKTIKIAKK